MIPIIIIILVLAFINPDIIYRVFEMMGIFLRCWVNILYNTMDLVLDLYTGIKSRWQIIRKGWKLWRRGEITIKSIREYCWARSQMYVMYIFDITLKSYPQHYELGYYHDSKLYRIVYPKRRGARPIVNVTTSDDVDITKEILETMGPSNNFHGIPTTPRMLGYSSKEVDFIKVKYKNGMIRTYQDDNVISLSGEND